MLQVTSKTRELEKKKRKLLYQGSIHDVVVLEDEHNPRHWNIAEEKEVQQARNAHGIGRGVSDEFRLFSFGDFALAHGKCATDHVVFTALSFFAGWVLGLPSV